jgi:hypothetical protein
MPATARSSPPPSAPSPPSTTYNAFGEPDSVTALHGPDTLFAARYTRDNLGRITGIEETILAPEPGQGGAAPRAPPVTRTLTYTYDAADRLHSWSLDGQVQETYGYDPNGNRTHVNGTEVATYDDQDRLVATRRSTRGPSPPPPSATASTPSSGASPAPRTAQSRTSGSTATT